LYPGTFLYADKIKSILLDQMGKKYVPKFLEIVKEAGNNPQTGNPGKKYLFFVPVNVAGNTKTSVEKLKELIFGLHDTEYKNDKGYKKTAKIVSLQAVTLESADDGTALMHINNGVEQAEHLQVIIKDEPVEVSSGGGGPGHIRIKEEHVVLSSGKDDDETGASPSSSIPPRVSTRAHSGGKAEAKI